MQGYYNLQSTLYFNHTYTAPVTFRSYQHQEVHVTGGTRINPSLFQPVTDPAILNVIPPVAHSKVRQIHLPDAGITDYGVMSVYGLHASRIAPLEVFINGSPLRIARWPNELYINIVGVPDGQFGLRFQHNSTRDSHWMNEKDPWVYGFWYWSWADASAEVAKIDPSNHMITLTNKTYYGLRTGHLQTDNRDIGYDKQGGYFRVLNMLSELDQPGEYYIDRSTGFLYLWPNTPTGTLQSSDVIYASILENCITLQDGVSNINFEDFTIENCRAFGLSATSSHNVTFRNLEVKNTGWVGISCRGDCRNVTVSKCDVHDCDGGVSIEGGDRPNLIPSGNLVEDNHIWRVGRVSVTGAMGVSQAGVHNIIRYNHIHNTTYACIFWGGNDHIMEYNYFQDCNQNASDGGAVHCDRDWTMRGNIIRYNYFHNTLRYWPGAQVRGIC
ncbi:hypothetical protein SNE40_006428 [Patella caerulea]|uniref:Right handed beta helix domain-containing protein n=1 Tax=Patella caerulea TaxID=87958 RepID=A0AAN8PSJ2_PATCE